MAVNTQFELHQPEMVDDTNLSPSDESHLIAETHAVVPLERLVVLSGAVWQETVRSVDDLVLGDTFRLPNGPEFQAAVDIDNANATVQLLADVRVGQSTFAATASHDVILMSGTGGQVHATLMAAPSIPNGFLLFETGMADDAEYTLVHVSETQPSSTQAVMRDAG